MNTLHCDHRVSFWVRSTSVTAAEMTAILGLEPDDVSVRGSRDPDFPSPRNHTWRISDNSSDRSIEDQVRTVVERLRPHREGILQLGALDGVFIQMGIYRELSSATEAMAVGWHLDLDTLAFLVSVGAEIDCDEYLSEQTITEAFRRWLVVRRQRWDRFLHHRLSSAFVGRAQSPPAGPQAARARRAAS